MADETPTGEIVITLESTDKKYQYADYALSYNSTDEEVIDALQSTLLEEEGFNLKSEYEEGNWTIKRADNSQSIYIFPKSTAGKDL